MIRRLLKRRERKQFHLKLSNLKRELIEGYTNRAYYSKGQVSTVVEKLGYGEGFLGYALAFFTDPGELDGILKKLGSKKTTQEIAKDLTVMYGVPSLVPEGYNGSLADGIQEFYFDYIAPNFTTYSVYGSSGDTGSTGGTTPTPRLALMLNSMVRTGISSQRPWYSSLSR